MYQEFKGSYWKGIDRALASVNSQTSSTHCNGYVIKTAFLVFRLRHFSEKMAAASHQMGVWSEEAACITENDSFADCEDEQQLFKVVTHCFAH